MTTPKVILSVWSVSCVAAFAPSLAQAKPPKDAKSKSTYGCARFDVDQNGVLSAAEKAELIKAFEAGDTALKLLDTNNDGKLDEAELSAIKLDAPEKKGKKKRSEA